MNDKKSPVVLITGASKGIGYATALEFASHGFSLIINYHKDDEAIKILENKLNEINASYLIVKADVCKEVEVKQMIETGIAYYGHIDVLVNNAGIALDSLYEDKTIEHFIKTYHTNLIGPFLVSKYVSPYMIERRAGRIINISSTNGMDTTYPESADYDASKAALISLTYNMAKQYAPYIHVNAIAPGWVNTEMNKEFDQNFIDEESQKTILHRFAEPEEIAKVIRFLASDDASYINGTVIRVDGGRNV